MLFSLLAKCAVRGRWKFLGVVLEFVQALRVRARDTLSGGFGLEEFSSPCETPSPRDSPSTRLPSMALFQCSSGTPMPSELYMSFELGATPSACRVEESISA